jgi:hypothetical protein
LRPHRIVAPDRALAQRLRPEGIATAGVGPPGGAL